jgi:hypothetical protein
LFGLIRRCAIFGKSWRVKEKNKLFLNLVQLVRHGFAVKKSSRDVALRSLRELRSTSQEQFSSLVFMDSWWKMQEEVPQLPLGPASAWT